MTKKENGGTEHFKVAVIAVLLGLLAGAVMMLILGKNPFMAYYNLLQGCGFMPKSKYAGGKSILTDLSSYIDFLTPMLFAALSVAVALKGGLFNIGISGQMLVGAFLATTIVGYSSLPAVLAKPLVIIIAALGGMLIGALIGFLKARFNINEVVSSIMLNYTAEYIITFFINTKYVDPISRQSKEISKASRLTLHQILIGGYRYDLAISFILAIAAIFIVRFILERTVLGYDIKAVGQNKEAARYAGIKVNRCITLSMAISGLLAGLAGASYYLGYFASMQPKTLPSTGFDAIAVCLVGGSSPIGIFFASLFLEIIAKGSTYMSSQAGLEAEIASVIMGLILLTSACSAFILEFLNKRKKIKSEKSQKSEERQGGGN
ncbi:MAG: ABC transporter permease [Lachnospiraceae bacterium]|nr:ABC transporter permease [Lachnospiraceae bacterium]